MTPTTILSKTAGPTMDGSTSRTLILLASLAAIVVLAWNGTVGGDAAVGIISAMTEHFCDDCNRLRLTATGDLHACLGHDDAVSLRDVLRRGGSDGDLVRAISGAVTGKRAGHAFEASGAGAPAKHMIGIGG